MLLDLGGVITLGDAVMVSGAVGAPVAWVARRIIGKIDTTAKTAMDAMEAVGKLAASQCEVNKATAHLLEVHAAAGERIEARVKRVESRMMEAP